MKTYEIRVVTHTSIKTYLAEAEDLLKAKELVENKYHKEHPTETIVRLELANPDKEKVGEILDLLKERV